MLGLPKWPQMLVWGDSVTQEQAQNIILRTDEWLTSLTRYCDGNDQAWKLETRKRLGLTPFVEKDVQGSLQDRLVSSRYERLLRIKLGFVETQYVHNRWTSCSYVGGAYGWCSPEGLVQFADNVGKWPNVEDVLEDWRQLAKAFPYLNCHVTLMSGEFCEEGKLPVVSFHVFEGQASQLETTVLPDKPITPAFYHWSESSGYPQEHGLPEDWIDLYGKILRQTLEELSTTFPSTRH